MGLVYSFGCFDPDLGRESQEDHFHQKEERLSAVAQCTQEIEGGRARLRAIYCRLGEVLRLKHRFVSRSYLPTCDHVHRKLPLLLKQIHSNGSESTCRIECFQLDVKNKPFAQPILAPYHLSQGNLQQLRCTGASLQSMRGGATQPVYRKYYFTVTQTLDICSSRERSPAGRTLYNIILSFSVPPLPHQTGELVDLSGSQYSRPRIVLSKAILVPPVQRRNQIKLEPSFKSQDTVQFS